MYRSDDGICKDNVYVIPVFKPDVVRGWMTSDIPISTYQCHSIGGGVESYCKKTVYLSKLRAVGSVNQGSIISLALFPPSRCGS